MAIRRCDRFRFDYFLRSCSAENLGACVPCPFCGGGFGLWPLVDEEMDASIWTENWMGGQMDGWMLPNGNHDQPTQYGKPPATTTYHHQQASAASS
jgi:hypothetical protein